MSALFAYHFGRSKDRMECILYFQELNNHRNGVYNILNRLASLSAHREVRSWAANESEVIKRSKFWNKFENLIENLRIDNLRTENRKSQKSQWKIEIHRKKSKKSDPNFRLFFNSDFKISIFQIFNFWTTFSKILVGNFFDELFYIFVFYKNNWFFFTTQLIVSSFD